MKIIEKSIPPLLGKGAEWVQLQRGHDPEYAKASGKFVPKTAGLIFGIKSSVEGTVKVAKGDYVEGAIQHYYGEYKFVLSAVGMAQSAQEVQNAAQDRNDWILREPIDLNQLNHEASKVPLRNAAHSTRITEASSRPSPHRLLRLGAHSQALASSRFGCPKGQQ